MKLSNGGRKVKFACVREAVWIVRKDLLTTRSTTATRSSQRFLLSTAAAFDFTVESWDNAGALLKGLNS